MRHRLQILAALVAFLVSQAALLDHRARHASEAASERASSACPHREVSPHFCAAAAVEVHGADCIYCTAGPGRLDVPAATGAPVAGPILSTGPVVERVVAPSAPFSGLHVPRGPPAA
jgi:hypothetical protein